MLAKLDFAISLHQVVDTLAEERNRPTALEQYLPKD